MLRLTPVPLPSGTDGSWQDVMRGSSNTIGALVAFHCAIATKDVNSSQWNVETSVQLRQFVCTRSENAYGVHIAYAHCVVYVTLSMSGV